ncbi:MAG: YcjF family protein [Chthoniobacterales bacterium]
MNQPIFLNLVERLEGFLGKLPASIQKPVLQELTPLKELFLKQRSPRFVLTGSQRFPAQEVIASVFAAAEPGDLRNVLMEVSRWHAVNVGRHGAVAVLDARGAESTGMRQIEEELAREPADMILHLVDGNSGRPVLSKDLEQLGRVARITAEARTKILGISLLGTRNARSSESDRATAQSKLQSALEENAVFADRLLQVFELPVPLPHSSETAPAAETTRLMKLLTAEMPNEARVEMVRISRDREAQVQIAHSLVKSTSAICTAIGAQPIPLADLPILTALQLMMVSGIMYIAGRERSPRVAAEFIGALGVNVGAGMVLREGARAVLKFFPGWGNVVCGMVAGAGTYGLGKAAIVYFLEGVTIMDARRTYLSTRKKAPRPKLLKRAEKADAPR